MQENQMKKESEKSAQSYYMPKGIPAELPGEKPGTGMGVFSILCACVALLFYPIIFGPIGIALGVTAKKRGSETLGIVGIVLSCVFMTISIAVGVLFYDELESAGIVLFGFF